MEYCYINTPENEIVARTLQQIWKDKLGVNVTLRPLTAEEYALQLSPTAQEDSDELLTPAFSIAAVELSASLSQDAADSLERWHSTSEDNFTGYSSPAFDILIKSAAAALAPETSDAYLHDAEAILLEDAPVVPLYYRGLSYALGDGLSGLYSAPNGVFFFDRVERIVPETE